MRKFLKTVSSILIVALLASCLCLAACHTPHYTSEFEMPESFDTSRTYEISFWSKNDSNTAQRQIYLDAIAEFEKLYPNIKINYKAYGDYGLIYRDVITNISTGTTPNVCIAYPDHIATYMTGDNIVAPLDDLINDERYGLGGSELKYDSVSKSEVVVKFLDEGKIGGVQYALPFMRSSEACYINKDMLEKLGYEVPDVLTWDFIWEVSEKAMEKNEDGTFKLNGQSVLIPTIYKSTDNMMISMLFQKNAGYSTEDGKIKIFNDMTKDILIEISKHARTRSFSTFKISSYPGNYFNAGQCIFAIDSTAGATWIGTYAPNIDIDEDDMKDFETVVRAIPQYDVDEPKMISQGPSICVFNKEDPQEVLASWIFTQFLLTNEVQIPYAQTEGYIPVTTRAHSDAEYKDYLSRSGEDTELYYDVKIAASNLVLDNIENTFVTPVFNGSADLRDAAGQLIEKVTVAGRTTNDVIDSAYIDRVYEEVATLNHLKQMTEGALPTGSVVLIVAIPTIWILIGAYLAANHIKNKKNRKNH